MICTCAMVMQCPIIQISPMTSQQSIGFQSINSSFVFCCCSVVFFICIVLYICNLKKKTQVMQLVYRLLKFIRPLVLSVGGGNLVKMVDQIINESPINITHSVNLYSRYTYLQKIKLRTNTL